MKRARFKRAELRRDLSFVLNKHSIDNSLNIPDFILADYLIDCVISFDKLSTATLEYEKS